MATARTVNGPIAADEMEMPGIARLQQVLGVGDEEELTIASAVGVSAPLDEAVVLALRQVVDEFARGQVVVVSGIAPEMTIDEAAALLNAPPAGLAARLSDGTLPSRMTDDGRRIRVVDVLRYKRELDEVRERALQRLADQSQEIAMLLT